MKTWKGKVIEVVLPNTMVLEVADCDPLVQGNTVQGITKPATLVTGAVVTVPGFIEIGEKIKVDTRDGGRYISREGSFSTKSKDE